MSNPAVYRFICPDGRSYVGSRKDITRREREGLDPYFSNPRILEALKKHPLKTWRFEILERLSSDQDRHVAEQRHIDRLRTWDPQYGFNILPAERLAIMPGWQDVGFAQSGQDGNQLVRGKKPPR